MLEKLYHHLDADEEPVNTPEYRLLIDRICDLLGTWQKKLPEDEFRQMESFHDWHCECSSMERAVAFARGFKLGAAVMLEVLDGREKYNSPGDGAP